MEALLRRPDLELLKAKSGREALEVLLVHEVAVALVDVQLPEMDGFALAELMRGAERTKLIPIILMTAGLRDHQRVFQGYEVGAVDFLFKPLEPRILLNKVETFVQLYRQRLELEHTLRLNEMFIAVLGHDLRNPVGAVVTTAALLAMHQDPAVRRSAARLHSSGMRMGRMIGDLLDLARSRLGDGIPLDAKPTELLGLLRRVADEIRLAYGSREVILHLPDDTEAPILGQWDEDRLSQLMANLLTNALQHGSPERPVSISVARDEKVALVSVVNEGNISAQLLPQLFDPFRSGSGKRPSPARGLGLGLYIVQQIATAHGGTIAVTSAGGLVTCTLRLPLARDSSRSTRGEGWERPARTSRFLVAAHGRPYVPGRT